MFVVTTPTIHASEAPPSRPHWLDATDRVLRTGEEHEVSIVAFAELDLGTRSFERVCPGCFLVVNAELGFAPGSDICRDCE
jgi:hypothetical protein